MPTTHVYEYTIPSKSTECWLAYLHPSRQSQTDGDIWTDIESDRHKQATTDRGRD